MAKYEKIVKGEYHEIVKTTQTMMEHYRMKLFEHSEASFDDVEATVMVYKKFHIRNMSKAVLNITLVGKGDTTYLTAIIYGGGQGIALDYDNGPEEDMLEFLQKCFDQII